MNALQLPYSSLIANAQQCRETDGKTIDEFGLSGATLMETAGLLAANAIADRFPEGSEGLFVCGKGNNGGDALVAARYLAIRQRHHCTIQFPGGTDSLSPENEANLLLLQKLKRAGGSIKIEPGREPAEPAPADYLVDGLFGTGLDADLRSPSDRWVETLNERNEPVFALDIPSGLHPDRGLPLPVAVRASWTLAFGALKPGFYLNAGPRHCGEIIFCPLSFPGNIRKGIARLITTDLHGRLPEIHREANHKYDGGVVSVIAGSEGLTGAAILSARAAWRCGTGSVFLFAPRGLMPVYETALPEVIKVPVGRQNEFRFNEAHTDDVLEHLGKRESVLLIGPGLGRDASTLRFASDLLSRYRGTAIMDADAIGEAGMEIPLEGNILTPHPGELLRLSGENLKDDFDRLEWIRTFAADRSCHLLSKGNPAMIASPEGEIFVTGYDTTLFARAGFGDLLAGTIAGNLAISGNTPLSLVRALIDGKRRADRYSESTGRPPQPSDLTG